MCRCRRSADRAKPALLAAGTGAATRSRVKRAPSWKPHRQLDPLQAVQAQIDRIGRQRRERRHVDEPDRGRLETIRGLDQLGSKRVVDGTWLIAVRTAKISLDVRLTGQDQVTLLDQPDPPVPSRWSVRPACCIAGVSDFSWSAA